MESVSWKEDVRKALSDLPRDIKIAEVARQTGIDSGRLYQFLSRGSLNAEDLRILDEWLCVHGHKRPSPIATEATRSYGSVPVIRGTPAYHHRRQESETPGMTRSELIHCLARAKELAETAPEDAELLVRWFDNLIAEQDAIDEEQRRLHRTFEAAYHKLEETESTRLPSTNKKKRNGR